MQASSRNCFLRKTTIQSDTFLTFRNSPVIKTSRSKHLRLILDDILNYKEHLKHENLKTEAPLLWENWKTEFEKNVLKMFYTSPIWIFVMLFTTNLRIEDSVRKENLFNTKQLSHKTFWTVFRLSSFQLHSFFLLPGSSTLSTSGILNWIFLSDFW